MSERSGRGGLLHRLSHWASSSDQEVRDLREAHESGQMTVEAAPERELVHLGGTLRAVTLRPRGGVPALEAELDDGTGVVVLVWLGRRRITGIQAGRALRASGRIGSQDGRRVIFNPRYELLS